jgi:SAM-dependent methyltransferase
MAQIANEVEWKGRTGPFSILLNPGVFHPTHTSRTLADALEISPEDTVIDVGCGSGVLSFVAARLGAKRVVGCDISEPAVVAARENASRLGLADRVEFRAGSLLEPVRDLSASVLIGDVSGIPDEIAEVAGWFPDGRAGGPTGAELPMMMLESIGDTLAPGGRLYLPTGTIQDEGKIIEAARRVFGDNMVPVLEREFPLPDIVGKSLAAARMMKEGLLNLHKRGSRWLWRLRIWRCVRA